MAADRQVAVGVSLGVERRRDGETIEPVGDVVVALASLVADHLLLVLQALLVEQIEQVAHPLALEPERGLQVVARDDLVVVGPV